MKKLICNIAAIAIVAIAATGCISVETNRSGAALTMKCVQEFQPTVKLAAEPVEAEANVNNLFGWITWGVSKMAVGVPFVQPAPATAFGPLASLFPNPAEIAKQGAVYNACINNNADFLAQPRYILTTKDFVVFKQINCKVIGYPGQVVKLTPIIKK